MIDVGYYAQIGEDRTIERLLGARQRMFWVDVGAFHPEHDSVTKRFYDRGGNGVNIEPIPALMRPFYEQRERDINICVAVSDYVGEATMTHIVGTGLSSLDPEYTRSGLARDGGHQGVNYRVPVQTLAHIFNGVLGSNPPHIDFLKIDVEGREKQVIAGNDWSKYRPELLVIEATEPCTDIPAWGEWEPLVLEAGYDFVHFDGLNRFYKVRPA